MKDMKEKTEATLKLYEKGNLIFSSRGKWLHPLFELEEYLSTGDFQPERRAGLFLEDKIVGRAAAHLIIRLGIKRLHAGILSSLGKEALDEFEISYSYDTLVEKIICKTERLLSSVKDPEESYKIIRELRGGKE